MDTKKLTKIIIIRGILLIVIGTIFRLITKPESPTKETITNDKAPITEELQIPEEINTVVLSGSETEGGTTNFESSILTILMPGWFYNDGFAQIANQLKKEKNIQINYKKIDNISYYKSLMQSNKQPEGIDIFLIPSDRLNGYEGQSILLQEDVVPFFNPIFSNHISTTNTTFIPYVIDPTVTITPDSTDINYEDILTFKNISDYIITNGNKNKIKMPILRGLDKNDLKILQNGSESFPNYFLITYNLLYQLYNSQENNTYDTISNNINNPTISKRTYANFKINFTKLLKKNPNCIIFPDICMIAYNYADIKFGFLSDILIQDSYFNLSGQATTTPQALNFPYLTGNYLVRGWGFVPSNTTKNTKDIQSFFQKYLEVGASNSISLRNDIPSPFNNILNTQTSNEKFQTTLQFLPQFSLIYNTTSMQDNFLKSNNLLFLLKEKNSSKEFFNQGNWNR